MRSIALLLHPYFNLVSNHQVPLNFVSFDTLQSKEDITINVICERNDFDRRSNSRQNRYIYIYICEASCVSHVLCVRIIVEGTCHAQDH